MAEFKVGDKVQAFKTTNGEITYGPVSSTFGRYTVYVVRKENGEEVTHRASDLTAAPVVPAFAVNDIVTLRTRGSARATVEYGPFDGGDVYVVRMVDPPADAGAARTFSTMASAMTKVDDKPALVPVGTRVRVDRAKWAAGSHGEFGVVTSNTETWRAHRGDTHPYYVRLNGGHI
ncbi:hypothetical protein, partial [Streptomyces sp. NPDC057748]